MAVEGKTSGKNTTSDQRQIQATSQSGSVFTGDNVRLNTGTSVVASGASRISYTASDFGAIESAFDFGKTVLAGVAKANTDSQQQTAQVFEDLGRIVTANSVGGANESQAKLFLYLGLGALALLGFFIFRR